MCRTEFYWLGRMRSQSLLTVVVIGVQRYAFSIGTRCLRMCVPPCYYMLRDVCSLMVIEARGCVVFLLFITCSDMCSPFYYTIRECVPPCYYMLRDIYVFPLGIRCSGMCISPSYYIFSGMHVPPWYCIFGDVCSPLVLHAQECVFLLGITCSDVCFSLVFRTQSSWIGGDCFSKMQLQRLM